MKFKKKYILGIIPARGGSVGIKNKNIFKIFGKELIKYTLEDAKKSTKITHLLLSTDSKKIHKVAKQGVQTFKAAQGGAVLSTDFNQAVKNQYGGNV